MRIVMVGNGRTVHALVRAAALAARGHAVRLVTLGPVLPHERIEVRTRPIPGGLGAALRAARGFWADIRSFEPDLLHVHYAGGKLGTLASLSRVRPLVVTVMGGDVQPEQHLQGLAALERRATRRLLAAADLVLAKSEALRREVLALGTSPARVHVVRWGIDPQRIHRQPEAAAAWRARLGLAADDRVVLSPRLLRPLYNVHLLVEGFPRVLEREPRALLLLTEHRADEQYRRTLAARIEQLGLAERVRFVGAVEHAQMPGLYSLAEVAVGIPFSDGLPQTLFEAMACATPSVIGKLAAYDELVRDGEHALCTALDPASVAEAVSRLLSDAPLARRVAAAGLQRVHEMALLPQEAERVERLYTELLARAPRRAPLAGRLLDGLSLLLR